MPEDRIVILKLKPTGKEPEIHIYQGIRSALTQLENLGIIAHDSQIIGAFEEVPSERLHP